MIDIKDLRVSLNTQDIIDELQRDDLDESQQIELLHRLANDDDAWTIVNDGLTIYLSPKQIADATDRNS